MEIYINYLLGGRARFGHKFVPLFTRLSVPQEREKEEADNSREGQLACKSLYQDESPLTEI